LLGEIKFVDQSISAMVSELDKRGFLRSTVVIVSAKHGQSPINPKSNHNIGDTITPALGNIQVLQATEDDVALLWLKDQSQANAAAAAISAAAASRHGSLSKSRDLATLARSRSWVKRECGRPTDLDGFVTPLTFVSENLINEDFPGVLTRKNDFPGVYPKILTVPQFAKTNRERDAYATGHQAGGGKGRADRLSKAQRAWHSE
jgi:hypothetical protein